MKLWIVESGGGKYIAKAQVYAEDEDDAIKAVKERVAGHIANFVGVSLIDVRVKVNAGNWTAVEAPAGIVKLEWDLSRAPKVD
jgi:hypothetical protein